MHCKGVPLGRLVRAKTRVDHDAREPTSPEYDEGSEDVDDVNLADGMMT